MERVNPIHKRNGENNRQKNHGAKDDGPRRLIIQSKDTKLKVSPLHIEIIKDGLSHIVGFYQFQEIYLHKDLELNIADLYELSKYIKVYIIDANGYVKAEFKRSEP